MASQAAGRTSGADNTGGGGGQGGGLPVGVRELILLAVLLSGGGLGLATSRELADVAATVRDVTTHLATLEARVDRLEAAVGTPHP